MPKRALFFCALLAACAVLFCACSSQGTNSVPQSGAEPGGQTAQASAAPARGAQALSDHYWIAASPDVITRGSANSAGFYQIIMQSNGRSNLLFTDHAAEKQVYLCSTPSCEHSDASCSSFIDSAGYYVFAVALEDKLLVV